MNRRMIGAFEAKTHLSTLLDRAAQGQRFVITKRGRPVAELVPYVEESKGSDLAMVLKELQSVRESVGENLDIKALREKVDAE